LKSAATADAVWANCSSRQPKRRLSAFSRAGAELQIKFKRRISCRRNSTGQDGTKICAGGVEHLGGTRKRSALPIDLQATAFQVKFGRNCAHSTAKRARYKQIAESLGSAKPFRAVARDKSVRSLIPVMLSSARTGNLNGYRWASIAKKMLLDKNNQPETAINRENSNKNQIKQKGFTRSLKENYVKIPKCYRLEDQSRKHSVMADGHR